MFDWVIGAVPTTYVIRRILHTTRSLFDSRLLRTQESLAILDGHVVRTDGHFKLPRKIVLKNGSPARAMIAMVGCGGFLLREVSLVESESAASHIRCITPILTTRKANGLAPPHVISDNPGMVASALRKSIDGIWGEGERFILSGDPVHRKIEFQESIDRTHQDASAATRDFAYIVKRFGFLLFLHNNSAFQTQYGEFIAHVDSLISRVGDTSGDRFSADHPTNRKNWKKKPTKECYLSTLTAARRHVRGLIPFKAADAAVIRGFCLEGGLKSDLPIGLRSCLVDYHSKTMRLSDSILPSGLVSRLLCDDDMRGAIRRKFPKRSTEEEYFPAYKSYEELVQDVVAFAEWYSTPRCARGARRRPMYREDVDRVGNSRYPIKQTGVLTVKSLDVLRRMILVQNSAYYLAHIAVANSLEVHSIRLDNRRPDTRDWQGPAEMTTAYSRQGLPKSEIRGASSSADVFHTTHATSEEDEYPRSTDSCNRIKFSLGTAAVESFFHEI